MALEILATDEKISLYVQLLQFPITTLFNYQLMLNDKIPCKRDVTISIFSHAPTLVTVKVKKVMSGVFTKDHFLTRLTQITK